MIEENLKTIGLNETETRIFLSVLENGKALPSFISKKTGIKRPTVYAAAEELVKKGILQKDISKKSMYYTVSSPDTIERYVNREKTAFIERMKASKEITKELQQLHQSKHYSVPRIQFVDGDDVEQFLYQQHATWIESIMGQQHKVWWGFQDHTFVEDKKFQDWIDWFWKEVPEQITLKLFSNEAPIEKDVMSQKQIARRQIRFWNGTPFTATQWVIGDYIVSVVTNQKPFYLVQTHDRLLADNLRNLYKTLWEQKDVQQLEK